MNTINPTNAAAPTRPIHGGIKPAELRALGLQPADCLDFSASVSPLGPPAAVAPAIAIAAAAASLAAYPDPHCLELKDAIAAHHASHRVAPANIIAGNGSTEIIHLLARNSVGNPPPGSAKSALLLTPTYGEYAGAVRLAGGTIHTLDATRTAAGFRWDLDAAARAIANRRPALVFICNPNNPTGTLLPATDLRHLTRACTAAGSLLVVDEAYINLADAPAAANAAAIPIAMDTDSDSVIVLRSMTKDYALTALRLGYAVARPPVIARLAALQPVWSVNGLAQAAGVAALSDADYLPRARTAVAKSRQRIVDGLDALDIKCYPASANFVLAQVGAAAEMQDATELRDALARQGLFVRDCASFGLPDCIRIGLRPIPDCDRLLNAIAALRTDPTIT